MDIDSIFSDFDAQVVKSIMVGTTIDFDKVKNVHAFKSAAVHCCLNGPVGVGKSTNFPGITEEIKLKELYEGRLSNKMWRNFCATVGEFLKRSFPDEVSISQQHKLFGDVWPIHDNE